VVDFDVDEAGNVFVLPVFRNSRAADQDEPLAVQLDGRGIRHRQLGRASAYGHGVLNGGFIEATMERLYVAHGSSDLLTIVDRATGSMTAARIEHPAFLSLRKLDTDPRFTEPAASVRRRCRYIAGIARRKDALLVVLDLPYVDIHRYDSQGRLSQVYTWFPKRPIRHIFGFAVARDEPTSVLVGVSYSLEENAVLKLTPIA